MDSLRGHTAEREHPAIDDEDTGHEPIPIGIGQSERRLQVRAYNFWAALLGDRQFPSVDALDPGTLPEFAAYCALLDVGASIEDPALSHVGAALMQECGASTEVVKLSEAPERSVLSRIADHYRQIFASEAPVGFEAEFVNWRGATMLYRGILLPFSRDDVAIDAVLCVINWKEVLDRRVANALEREIAESYEPLRRLRFEPEGMADWANGPGEIDGAAGVKSTGLVDGLAFAAELPGALPSYVEALRMLPEVPLGRLPTVGEEFTLLLARRDAAGRVVVVGEVAHEPRMIERAARSLTKG